MTLLVACTGGGGSAPSRAADVPQWAKRCVSAGLGEEAPRYIGMRSEDAALAARRDGRGYDVVCSRGSPGSAGLVGLARPSDVKVAVRNGQVVYARQGKR